MVREYPSQRCVSLFTCTAIGSSSMATVCGGSLALFDAGELGGKERWCHAVFAAGVQISKPVAGVACGLILDNDSGRYQILSDLSVRPHPLLHPLYTSCCFHRESRMLQVTWTSRWRELEMVLPPARLGCNHSRTTLPPHLRSQVDLKGCHGISYELFQEAVKQSRGKVCSYQSLPGSSLTQRQDCQYSIQWITASPLPGLL